MKYLHKRTCFIYPRTNEFKFVVTIKWLDWVEFQNCRKFLSTMKPEKSLFTLNRRFPFSSSETTSRFWLFKYVNCGSSNVVWTAIFCLLGSCHIKISLDLIRAPIKLFMDSEDNTRNWPQFRFLTQNAILKRGNRHSGGLLSWKRMLI